MNKRAILVLAALFIFMFTVPVWAAPMDAFADVPAKHWAYDAVKQLAKAGIVEGYGDGTFRGQNTITRYEMAIITANAMTKLEKADAQQKALIDKLAAEFNEELVKLGVRVAKLEAAQPNLRIGGQARLSYTYRSDGLNNPYASTWGYDPSRHNYFTYRLRLEVTGQPDPNLLYFARLTGQDYDVQTGGQNLTATKTFNDLNVEQFWVKWKMNKEWSVTGGRQALLLGKGNFAYTTGGNDIFSVDYNTQKIGAKVAFWNVPGTSTTTAGGDPNIYFQEANKSNALMTQLTFTSEADTRFNIFNIHQLEKGPAPAGNLLYGMTSMYHMNLTSFGVDTKIGDSLRFFGEYAKNSAYHDHSTGYWYGLTNGDATYHPGLGMIVPVRDWTKVGANAQAILYRYYGANVQSVFNAQYNALLGNDTLAGALWLANTKGLEFYSQNVVAKNVFFLTQIGYADNIDTGKKETSYAQFALYLVF
jgi:hypothetical protein